MSLLVLLIVLVVGGLIVGGLARLALPGPDPMSIPMTIVLGIAGSFLGGLVARIFLRQRRRPHLRRARRDAPALPAPPLRAAPAADALLDVHLAEGRSPRGNTRRAVSPQSPPRQMCVSTP